MPPRKLKRLVCRVPGCKRKATCRGCCSMHYKRFHREGNLDMIPKKQRLCTVDGCTNRHRAKGLCTKHYQDKANKDRAKKKPPTSGAQEYKPTLRDLAEQREARNPTKKATPVVCGRCGAVVANVRAHGTWHAEMRKALSDAMKRPDPHTDTQTARKALTEAHRPQIEAV